MSRHVGPVFGRYRSVRIVLVALFLAAGRPAAAQNAGGAAALGVGDNFTALARGRDAAGWNPAALALPDGPAFSLALLTVRASAGIGPVTLADLARAEDGSLSAGIRESWLERVTADGGERGAVHAEVVYLALAARGLGIQVSSRVNGEARLSPDATELLLFGNAGRTGETREFHLGGSRADIAATTTVALSYAHALPVEWGPASTRALTVGATLKYMIGHAVLSARDLGSSLAADTLRLALDFPILHSDSTPRNWSAGGGPALDIGAAWQSGTVTAALVIRDMASAFAWDEQALVYRPGTATVDADRSTSDFSTRPLGSAPPAVRAWAARRLQRLTPPTTLAAGVAVRMRPDLVVAGELRYQLRREPGGPPEAHAGIGAEIRPVRWLPLRAGIAAVPAGLQVAGGLGIDAGPLEVGVAAGHRTDRAGAATLGMLSVSLRGPGPASTAH